MKNGKANGPDEILTEVLKALRYIGIELVSNLSIKFITLVKF